MQQEEASHGSCLRGRGTELISPTGRMVGKASLALSGVPRAEDAVGRAWLLLCARLQEGGPKASHHPSWGGRQYF